MKVRFLVAIILLIIGGGLALAAVTAHGVPWGFRDRAAVILNAVGGVEVFAKKRGTDDGTPVSVSVVDGLGLMVGDEIRVGALSAVDVRFPTADVTLTDGTRVNIDDHALRVGRGSGEIHVTSLPFRVEPAGFEVAVALDPGQYRFLADGRATMLVLVKEGQANASTGQVATAGKMLRLDRGRAPSLVDVPEPPKCKLRCRVVGTGNAVADGDMPLLATVWVNGALISGDDAGRFSIPVPLDGETGQSVMFARDVAGQACRSESKCTP